MWRFFFSLSNAVILLYATVYINIISIFRNFNFARQKQIVEMNWKVLIWVKSGRYARKCIRMLDQLDTHISQNFMYIYAYSRLKWKAYFDSSFFSLPFRLFLFLFVPAGYNKCNCLLHRNARLEKKEVIQIERLLFSYGIYSFFHLCLLFNSQLWV